MNKQDNSSLPEDVSQKNKKHRRTDIKTDRFIPKPDWLRVKLPSGDNFRKIKSFHDQLGIKSVCKEANCPNRGECWNTGTASFMLMGDTCTRGCRFCAVKTSKNPPALDPSEPKKLAETLSNLNLNYVVLTTVDRDDLPDQGANHITRCIKEIKTRLPDLIIEALIPDFRGIPELLDIVSHSGAEVISHNIECTRTMTQKVRDPRAGYDQSLQVLHYIKSTYPELYTKSSLMLGFGEREDEILQTMQDLRDVNTDFLTLGQYLQPSRHKLPVEKYYHPDVFKQLGEKGRELGFEYVASGPLVRSSYKAAEHYLANKLS
ncbi:lipoyl synthase [bacterium]|nr:lipoyl synthase [bacterium]